MRRKLIVAGLVVVVLALVLWRWPGGADGAGSASGGAGASGSSALERGGGSAKRAGARTPAMPASVSGRVTRKSDGTGIAEATVSLARGEFGAEIIPAETPTIVVTTGADGTWTASHVAPGTYVVAATAVGFLPGSRDRLAVGSGEQKTGVDLALDAGGTIVRGTVTDVGGGPIPGARVTAHLDLNSLSAPADLVALTTTNGTYQLSLPDGTFGLAASHDDYTKSRREVVVAGKPLVADFVLVPGGVIRGQVVARDTGKPVALALVSAESGGRRRSGEGAAIAGDDGKFVLRHLDSGLVSITAAGRGYASATPTVVPLAIGEQLDDVRVVVDRAYSISGTIVRKGKGTGVAGVRLGAFSFASKQQVVAIDPTDDDGRFEILGVRPSSYLLFAIGEGLIPDIGKQVEVVDRDVDDVRIELDAGVTLAGRVEPPGRAEVSLTLAGSIGIGNMFDMIKVALVRGESDETGAFELHAVPPGKLVVLASTAAGDGGKLEVTVGDADQRGLVLPMKARAVLVGRVIDTHDAPVAGVTVNASRTIDNVNVQFGDFDRRDGAVTAADGSFRVVGIEPGKVRAWVTDDDGPLAFKDKTEPTFDVALGSEAPVTLVVEARDGVIRGRVVGKDGAGVADAWVTAHTVAAPATTTTESFGDVDSGATAPPVLTRADGAFTFEHLRKGTYEVVADGPTGASRASKDGVKLGDTVTLTLAPLGSLSGTVERGPTPVQTYDLSCKGPDGDIERRIANLDGAYALEHLAPGPYTCVANTDTGTAKGSVDVPQGEAHLSLALTDWASVSGTVVNVLTGKPVAGVSAVADSGQQNEQMMIDALTGRTVLTDAAGRFTVERVPAGTGKLMLFPKGAGFEPLASQPYTAASGQHVDLGTIKVVPPRTGDAGTLGMGTNLDGTALVVADVKVGGPAEGAGVKAGDKIVSIDGTPVDGVGAAIGQQLLASGTIGVGQVVQLGIERGTTAVQVTLVATKW